jgi:hypothetical protein
MLKTFFLSSVVALNLFFVSNHSAPAQIVGRAAKSRGVAPAAQNDNDFTGRFTDGVDYVVYFERSKYGLTLRPALWTATQLLRPSGKDEFVVVDRPERGVTFQRDDMGRVVSVTIRGMEGEGLKLLRAGRAQQQQLLLLPVELILSGRGRDGARVLLAKGVRDAGRFIELARNVLTRFPSKSNSVVSFLSEAAPQFPHDAPLHALLGYAYVEAGSRRAALSSFRLAYSLEPTNKEAIAGLAMLNALPASANKAGSGWTLPFPLSSVFEKPTAAEIREVERDWQSRDLSPRSVQEVFSGQINSGQSSAKVRIVSHLVHGQRHYGAIIVPSGAKPGCCPVIVEVKGVSPNYFPLNLERLDSPSFMGELQERVIYVVPSFRGEVLNFNGATYQSEGDRTDAWDGATDDALALLNVALLTTPEADSKRICAFGRSRGGTVALLMGIRDPRIRCVAEWSGPSDWFELMGTEGWTQQEIFAEGLRTQASPSETGGQLLEHFLLKAVRGEENLKAVRHRMIASSPLYFAKHLPLSQLHYGEEDPFVPVRNGLRLVAELKRQRIPPTRYQAFFYPGQGHDTDRLVAPVLTRQFIQKALRLETK